MAVHRFTNAAGTGAPGTVGNWWNVTAGATTTSFSSGDSFIIPKGVTADVEAGTITATGAYLTIQDGYQGEVKGLVMTLVDLYCYGSNTVNLDVSVTGIARIGGVGKCNLHPSSAKTVAEIDAYRATYDVSADQRVDVLSQDGGNGAIANNSNAITRCDVSGNGVLNTERDGMYIASGGARVKINGTVAKPLTGTTAESGGFVYNNTGVDLATDARINVKPGGTYDTSGSNKTFDTKEVKVWNGGKANLETALGTATNSQIVAPSRGASQVVGI